MKNIKLLLVAYLIFCTPFSSANSSQLEQSKRLLSALNYPALLKDQIINFCSRTAEAESIKFCSQPQTVSNELIIDVAAKYFVNYVSPDNINKLIGFWESKDGVRISNGLTLAMKTGRQDILSDTDLITLDNFNQTEENKESLKFADDLNASVRIIREIYGLSNKIEGDKLVTDDEVRRAYEIYAETWTENIEYDVRHIMLKTHEEAATALQRVQKGELFAQVATAVSIDSGSRDIGGELGWQLPAGLTPHFSEAMVSLVPKGLSPEPVKTPFGWHIIEVKATRKGVPPPFEKVKDELGLQLEIRKSMAP